MSHTSMILTALMLAAMAIFFAPNILASNRGNILRNMALWVAIFLALALVYKNFGPDSPHPMFQQPASMVGMHPATPAAKKDDAAKGDWKDDAKDGDKDTGAQGFTPPKE